MAASKSDSGRSSNKPDGAITAAITITFLRVTNKIQQGRRISRDYGAGVSLTLIETEMCAMIARNDGITGSELSDELAVSRSATSQVISKLKVKGLVSERASERNAKRKELSLTPHGHTAAAIADDFQAAMADALFGGVGAAELRAYLRFVTKLEAFNSAFVKQWKGDAAFGRDASPDSAP